MPDLVIRGGAVCDGTGASVRAADVAVESGRITAVGRIRDRGRREIDADGLVVAPGFIDVHTHYDCQLFWDPGASPSPAHGVTTVVTGNCGFTIAPCRPQHRETIMRLLSFVEGMPRATLEAGLPWTWEGFGEYLAAIEAERPALNVAALVGHSAARLAVMGADALERTATSAERDAMAGVVRDAMAAGAIGWSTSLAPTHFFADDGRPAPSRLADQAELEALAAVLAPLGHGVIEIAPASLLGPVEDKLAEMDRFAALARVSGKLVTWAPLFQSDFAPEAGPRCLDAAAALQAEGLQVVPQVGCRPLELRFDFERASFGLENNPVWRERLAMPRAERRRLFADPTFRRSLEDARTGFVAAIAPGWDRLVLRLPATDATRRWQDRSVASIAQELERPPSEVFCDLVLADDLAGQWGALLMNTHEERMVEMIRHPAGQLALSDAGAHVDTLCDQGFTTWLLGWWVRERGRLPLEEAVRLITSVPADRYGLVARGRVVAGGAADLVLFDPTRVGTAPTHRVQDLPGGAARLVQGARGVEWVLVRGTAVVEGGQPTGARPGGVLPGGRERSGPAPAQ